jgi:hypothetical protein
MIIRKENVEIDTKQRDRTDTVKEKKEKGQKSKKGKQRHDKGEI